MAQYELTPQQIKHNQEAVMLLQYLAGQIDNGWLIVEQIEFADRMNITEEQEEIGIISRVSIGHGLTMEVRRNGPV